MTRLRADCTPEELAAIEERVQLDCGVYALVEPGSSRVRYVGSSKQIRYRYYCHCTPSKRDLSAKAQWVRELQSRGLQPGLVVLEVTDQAWRFIRESRHIDAYVLVGEADLNDSRRQLTCK